MTLPPLPAITRCLWPIVVAVVASCDATPAPPPPAASRFEAVVAAPKAEGPDLAEFCDTHSAVGAGNVLSPPPTDGALAPATGKPRWINVWATWCKPCLEEMPRLGAFAARLAQDGSPVELAFISADERDEDLQAHLTAHPELPKTTRLTDSTTLKPWLEQLGLDAGAGLPVHIFTDGENRVRCVRAGGVVDNHYDFVAAALGTE